MIVFRSKLNFERTVLCPRGSRCDRGIDRLPVGTGIPEHRARVYDTGVRGGGILLGVEAKSDEEVEKLQTLLEDIGADYVRAE